MTALLARSLFVSLLFAATALAVAAVRPAPPQDVSAPDLEALLPDDFGGWRRIALSDAVLPQELQLGPGEAVAYRAYADDLGRIVTLVAAYGPPLGDSVRLHRPESCYVAQGFAITARNNDLVEVDGMSVPVVNLTTESPARREAVTYWLRNGGAFTTRAAQSQWTSLLRKTPLDGALVRVSTVNGQQSLFDLHKEFLVGFAAALSPQARKVLLGGSAPS